MVEAQQEQRERMRQLKRAMVEHDMLGDFIRLVDYMAAEHLFKNCVMTIRMLLELLKRQEKLITFQITISFAGDALAFIPSEKVCFAAGLRVKGVMGVFRGMSLISKDRSPMRWRTSVSNRGCKLSAMGSFGAFGGRGFTPGVRSSGSCESWDREPWVQELCAPLLR